MRMTNKKNVQECPVKIQLNDFISNDWGYGKHSYITGRHCVSTERGCAISEGAIQSWGVCSPSCCSLWCSALSPEATGQRLESTSPRWPPGLPGSTSPPEHTVLAHIIWCHTAKPRAEHTTKPRAEHAAALCWGRRHWPEAGWTPGRGGTAWESPAAQTPPRTPARPRPQTRCPALCCHEGWWSEGSTFHFTQESNWLITS